MLELRSSKIQRFSRTTNKYHQQPNGQSKNRFLIVSLGRFPSTRVVQISTGTRISYSHASFSESAALLRFRIIENQFHS